MDSMGMDKERVNDHSPDDRWLDDALAQYGRSEPRPGLEMRVLASLQAEKARREAERPWWWAAGMVAAASAVVVMAGAMLWFGRGDRAQRPALTSIAAHGERTGVASESAPPVVKNALKEGPRRPIHRAPLTQQAAAPRLEQFPTPAPLSDQERLLARYVKDFPEKATLVAQIQTDLHKQDEREMAAPWPESSTSTHFDWQK